MVRNTFFPRSVVSVLWSQTPSCKFSGPINCASFCTAQSVVGADGRGCGLVAAHCSSKTVSYSNHQLLEYQTRDKYSNEEDVSIFPDRSLPVCLWFVFMGLVYLSCYSFFITATILASVNVSLSARYHCQLASKQENELFVSHPRNAELF